jgi:ribosomal protein S18 acetylase RimI-like enzyme
VYHAGVRFRIRPGDRGDSRFLAWVMEAAGRSHLPRGIWDLAIPDDDRRIDYLDALVSAEPRAFWHWSWFLVAELDGRHAAALAGYEPRVALRENGASTRDAERRRGISEAESRAIQERMSVCAPCFPEIPEDRFVVEWVATLPEFRGRGIVHQLLLEVLDRGRAAGYQRAQVAVLIGNTPAQRAYEGVGFKVVDARRDAGFEAALGCPGIARLHRDL